MINFSRSPFVIIKCDRIISLSIHELQMLVCLTWVDFAFGYELGDRFLLFVLVRGDRAINFLLMCSVIKSGVTQVVYG